MFNMLIDGPKPPRPRTIGNTYLVLSRAQNSSVKKNAQNSFTYDQAKMSPSSNVKTTRKMSLSSANKLTQSRTENTENQHRRVLLTQNAQIPKISFQQISAMVRRLSRQVQGQDNRIKTIENQINGDFIVQRTLSTLKNQSTLKRILNCNSNNQNSALNEVYDHLFNIKLEMQNMKEEISKSIKKKYFDLDSMTGNDRIRQQLIMHKIEVKNIFEDLKAKISTCSYRAFNLDELDRINADVNKIKHKLELLNPQLKISDMLSYLPGIKYKYQQVIKLQSGELKIAQNLYYIDCEGYLLDSQNHYIVNQFESKVKVDSRHLQKLKEHGILSNRQRQSRVFLNLIES